MLESAKAGRQELEKLMVQYEKMEGELEMKKANAVKNGIQASDFDQDRADAVLKG